MFDAVRTFSSNTIEQRVNLGERVTKWLQDTAGAIEIEDYVVTQSSDRAYHCLTITIFYRRV